jgi:surfactin family lipopeptide synthetase A
MPDFYSRLARTLARRKRQLAFPSAGDDLPIPLSYSQEWIWVLDQIEGSLAYHLPNRFRIQGTINLAALRAALSEIERRHEILRTTIAVANGEPAQIVHAPGGLPFTLVDLSGLPEPLRKRDEARLTLSALRLPFDLFRGPLIRCCLIRLSEDEHLLHIVLHHIVSDAWSAGLLKSELATLYSVFCEAEPVLPPAPPLQYRHFALWQRRRPDEETASQLAYWRRQLADVVPLELPTDRPRPDQLSRRGGTLGMALSAETATELRAIGKKTGLTLFMVLVSAYKVLLFRYTRQKVITIGAPVAERPSAVLDEIIGCFLNTLVLKTDLGGNPTFTEVMRRVGETCFDAYENADIPFQSLVQDLRPARHLSRMPFFDVSFIMLNTLRKSPSRAPRSSGEQELKLSRFVFEDFMTRRSSEWVTAEMDLAIYCNVLDRGAISIRFEYSTDLFDRGTIERMLHHFVRLLEEATLDPDRPIDAIPILNEKELAQLESWNSTEAHYPPDDLLHELFREQARLTPSAPALVFSSERLTYEEVDRQSNRLAHWLVSRGIKPDSVVGVCMLRSTELVIALLGILKAGAAYLPLDPDDPPERIGFMLRDARSSVLLTQESLRDRLASTQVPLFSAWTELEGLPSDPIDVPLSPDNLAYVIYTSGSTGKPKGVMNSHRGICNRLRWMQDAYRLGPEDGVLQKTPYTFDVSVWELFWPLITGARLVLALPGGHKDPEYLVSTILQESITTIHFVPSMLRAFVDTPGLEGCSSLKRVICSGEALAQDEASKLVERCGAELHNLYGPTEAAVDVTFWPYPRGWKGPIPIGWPIANTQIHILNDEHIPVPVGVPGELYIGGVNLARGYLGRPDLTAEWFVPNPLGGAAGTCLYRTGDLASRSADGSVQYLGRLDFQVKVRGFRIELGEIEAKLLEHPAVKNCVVVARTEDGEARLVAYLVLHDGKEVSIEDLRRGLERWLPEYKIPGRYVFLPELPHTSSGKVDRKALPTPESSRPKVAPEFVAPRNALECALADIWKEVLHLDQVGILDNFFALGGHSLSALRMLPLLQAKFGVNVPLRILFENPTVERLTLALILHVAACLQEDELEQLLSALE